MNKNDFEITLVNQIDDCTCIPACMAMISGFKLEDVLHIMEDIRKPPYSEHETMIGLVRLKVLPIQILGRVLKPFHLYMAMVPSLNAIGVIHAIVIDVRDGNLKVFDPQNGRTDKKFYTDQYLPGNWCQLVSCERV